MEKQINIVKLIENNPVKRLSDESQSKLLLKIKEQFTSDEQQFFIASFYCYLNYKEEFMELFNKYFKLTEQRIRFNKPSKNSERGFYRISLEIN